MVAWLCTALGFAMFDMMVCRRTSCVLLTWMLLLNLVLSSFLWCSRLAQWVWLNRFEGARNLGVVVTRWVMVLLFMDRFSRWVLLLSVVVANRCVRIDRGMFSVCVALVAMGRLARVENVRTLDRMVCRQLLALIGALLIVLTVVAESFEKSAMLKLFRFSSSTFTSSYIMADPFPACKSFTLAFPLWLCVVSPCCVAPRVWFVGW